MMPADAGPTVCREDEDCAVGSACNFARSECRAISAEVVPCALGDAFPVTGDACAPRDHEDRVACRPYCGMYCYEQCECTSRGWECQPDVCDDGFSSGTPPRCSVPF